ncbi:sulfite exporter TauE/SafE family protein [Accumulibacter sp.]|uniref:sulfite exporter TauE/SafE family protein n=1 Tax=Accumulibacter sp. TaxID=2053492 RepID=UPI0025D62D80|nr:sulfite exporter TauE/SafE family protein [Accumulibacter sp.]MCM8637067.1 sulfite exporter TauE/SafE family protein [Accumulibacter sp.]MCM8640654.1 sulfite exporter TauE/SafE family protein [Accumulibacter sp.]
MPIDQAIVAPLLGAAVGLVLALTGAGGGIIAVPLLVFGLALPMQQAGPIGLLAVGLAAGLGALLGLRSGILRYRAAGLIGLCGILAAPAGVWLAHRIPNQPLTLAFALLLAWTGGRRLWRLPPRAAADVADKACRLNPAVGRFDWNRRCARVLGATGVVSGLLSGLLGVGGGFVIIPALSRHSDLPPASVVATSLGVMTLVASGGVAAAALAGSIVWQIALPFAGGAMAGLLLGRLLAARLAGERLQQGFAVLCLIVAGLLLGRVVAAVI